MRAILCVGYFLIHVVCSMAVVPQLAPQEIVQSSVLWPLAQTSEGSTTPSISGLVLRSGTNEPVRKAQVDLYPIDGQRSSYRAVADGSGHFLIQAIEPGRYHLRVSRIGYLTQSYGEDSSGGPGAVLTLAAGPKMLDLIFRMIPWGVISGRVTDEYGGPTSGAEVVALRSHMHNGQRRLSVDNSVETNDIGEYRLYGLAKGHYYIRVGYSEGHTPDHPIAAAQMGYVPIFYPGTPDVTRAVAVEMSSGQEVPSVDFSLFPASAVRIHGSLYNAILSKPANGCCVFLEPRDSNIDFSALRGPGYTLDLGGKFEINGVVPGSYTLIASALIEGKIHYAHLAVEVGKTDLDGLKLVIMPRLSLTGRVVVEGHVPVALSALHVYLEGPDPDPSYTHPADVKPDGTYKLADISLGTYEIGVFGEPPEAFLKSAKINGQDILNAKLDVSTGGSLGPIEVVLSSAGHQLDGMVIDKDDVPISGASVVLIPSGTRRSLYRLYKDVTTDQYGKFVLRGIAPGDYKVFAWKDVEHDEWQDADFLKPFESKGVEMVAEENGHTSMRLKLIYTQPER